MHLSYTILEPERCIQILKIKGLHSKNPVSKQDIFLNLNERNFRFIRIQEMNHTYLPFLEGKGSIIRVLQVQNIFLKISQHNKPY